MTAKGALAAESVAAIGPMGGSDIGGAFLPEDELWVSAIMGPKVFKKYHNDDGGEIPLSCGSNTLGIDALYAWPKKLRGGTLASSEFVGYDQACIGDGTSSDYCSADVKDIYTDALMWSKFIPSASISDQVSEQPIVLAAESRIQTMTIGGIA